MSDLLLRKQYGQCERAIRKKNLGRFLSLIRKVPALRTGEEGGELLAILQYSTPRWIESAFKAGLSPDPHREPPGQTFLQHAAANGNAEWLRLALRYGANPKRRSSSGETALGYACSWNQLVAVRLLIEAGADVNAIEDDPDTGYRCTALDCAKDPEIIAYLRAHGAKRLDELEA